MANPFISDTDLGNYLNRDLTDDDFAAIVLDSACEIVRNFTGLSIDASEDDSQKMDGTGTSVLVLPETPVTAVDSVTVDSDTSNPTTLTVSSDYVVDLDRGLIHKTSGNWGTRPQSITVVYDHGWSTVPTDIRLVALHLAARIFDHPGTTQENIGSFSANYESGSVGLLPPEKNILRKYRRAVA